MRSGGIGETTWFAPRATARLAWGTAITISFIADGAPVTKTARITRGDRATFFIKTLVP